MTTESERQAERIRALEVAHDAHELRDGDYRAFVDEKFRARDEALQLLAEPNRLRFENLDRAVVDLQRSQSGNAGATGGRTNLVLWVFAGATFIAACIGIITALTR